MRTPEKESLCCTQRERERYIALTLKKLLICASFFFVAYVYTKNEAYIHTWPDFGQTAIIDRYSL